jgi:hypothetical protein
MNDVIIAKLMTIVSNATSSIAMQRTAEIAISILFNYCGIYGINLVKNEVIPCFIELIQSQDVNSISASDIEKFLNPTAITGLELLNINPADIKITNADRRKDSSRKDRRGDIYKYISMYLYLYFYIYI